MGRLLKKKEPNLKKKNKSDEKPSAESETASLTLTNRTTAGTVNENQQKTTPVKKSVGSGSSLKISNKYVDQALQFLREVKVELKKVAWPTRKQTMGSTIVVVILVMLVAFFLGLVDVGLSSLIKAVLS